MDQLLKRHAASWFALAVPFKVKPKSIETFNHRLSAVFIYTQMPLLAKQLELALRDNVFTPLGAFKCQKNSALPQFLYELFIKVFDKDGYIRVEPDVLVIRHLRQLLLLFYKFEVPFSSIQEEEATQKFVDTDCSVKTTSFPFGITEVRANMLSLLPSDPYDIRPHHSNGATADRGFNNYHKRVVRRFFPSLMKEFPPHYFFNCRDHAYMWSSSNKVPLAEIPARLAFVPKDSRGPRSICMEPHELMFIQKGLQTLLYDYIENHSCAKGYINFTDQSINQYKAYTSSIDCRYATIDLKDASDLVSWDLIKLLVSPEWFRVLNATRSSVVELPNGEHYKINKFASMGSALCFPIEAMVFWSIARTVTPQVWVYGDDIIIPREKSSAVMDILAQYGMRVNIDKSCTTGLFRESCGAEYYNGHDISYIKLRSYDLVNYVAFANLISEEFGQSTGDSLIKLYENFEQPVFRCHSSERNTPEPGVFYSDSLASNDVFFKRRYNEDLQKFEYRRLVVNSKFTTFQDQDGYDRLFSFLTERCSYIQPDLDRKVADLIGDYREADYLIKRRILTVLPSVSSKIGVRNTKPLKFRWV